MKYYVTIEEHLVEIELSDTPAGYTATVEGTTHAIDVASVSGDAVYSLLVDGRSHDILVESTAAGVEITVGADLFQITVQDEWERRLANIQRRAAVEGGETIVRAPMPGAVVAAEVTAGARVKRGDGLIVLSAMKMENEIRAPRDGIVLQVLVAVGDKVERNASLVIIGTG